MALSPGTHGVIVTHGIGDNMRRGELLADFANSLADALMESPTADKNGKATRPVIRRVADIDANPPSVMLYIKSPKEEEATWLCKEAFWADAFPPPKATAVVWWLLTQHMGAQIRYVLKGLKDPGNDVSFMRNSRKAREERSWNAGIILSTVYRIEMIAMGLFLLPLSFIMPVILFLVWLLQWIPRFGAVDSILQWIHKLDPFLSNSLGDVKQYVENGVWSANARARLEKVVIDMLNDRFGKVEDITIVAHSMGCVVAYDALGEDGDVAREVARLEALGSRKKITFVSVGSGINQVFRLARSSNTYARQQFSRPLAKEITGYSPSVRQAARELQEKFYWVDIYARFDPVPAGDLNTEIIRQAQVDEENQVKPRKVINQDDLFRDHTSYWANKDLVIPRILRAINGGTDYPWPEAGITPEKISRHTRNVARFGLLKMAVGLLVVGCLVIAALKYTGML